MGGFCAEKINPIVDSTFGRYGHYFGLLGQFADRPSARAYTD
jgi:hypothetical protein